MNKANKAKKNTKLLNTIKWCRPLPFVYHDSSSAKTHLLHQCPTLHGHCYSDIKCHSNHYINSFLPSTTRLWKKLPYSIFKKTSLFNLKRFLIKYHILLLYRNYFLMVLVNIKSCMLD